MSDIIKEDYDFIIGHGEITSEKCYRTLFDKSNFSNWNTHTYQQMMQNFKKQYCVCGRYVLLQNE